MLIFGFKTTVLLHKCHKLDICVSPNTNTEVLFLNMMAFEGGAFGTILSHDGNMLMNKFSALIKRDRRKIISLHHESIKKMQLFTNRK